MNNEELKDINNRIGDRTDCFYWQTDRKVTASEAAMIWKDRHEGITNEALIEKINVELEETKIVSINPFDINAQTSFGNVNSLRVGKLIDGREIIIRCHPKGINNGYFYAESLAATLACNYGLPSYKTYCIHDLANQSDIAYQVIEKLEGQSVKALLELHPEKEEQLVYEMGKMMARLHKIKVKGFGPFDNAEAKKGDLVGIHSCLSDAVNAGLEENLERLVKYDILSSSIASRMKLLFHENPMLQSSTSVLVHNDFADWNLLTDGNSISGIIDWDECVGGNPIEDIACWSTFFDLERLDSFIKGYFSETPVYDHFDEMFQLMRLRYTISKMALRVKRFTYEPTPFMKTMIEKGTIHLNEAIKVFQLDKE